MHSMGIILKGRAINTVEDTVGDTGLWVELPKTVTMEELRRQLGNFVSGYGLKVDTGRIWNGEILMAREIKIKLIKKSVSLSDCEYGCDRVNQSASKGMSGCGSHSGIVALHQTLPSLYPLP